MSDFGELVLVLGDLHIPHRAIEIPEQFQKMLQPNKKIQRSFSITNFITFNLYKGIILTYFTVIFYFYIVDILCTGELITTEQYDDLKRISPNIHVVRGQYDDDIYAESKVIMIGAFKIGLIHGHQILPWLDNKALAITQREMDVDILITGLHVDRS